MEAALARVDGEDVAHALKVAARFVRSTTPEEHLAACLRGRPGLENVLGLIEGLDHVGFLAPVDVAPELPAVAAAAGFDVDPHTFESTILARHLAELAQREAVPTSIFKARWATTDGGTTGVEVAMPGAVGRKQVREWIAGGVGTHVAFRVRTPSCFAQLGEILTAAGYRMPAFTGGRAMTNPVEQLEAVFFDRRPDEPVGLEFCAYDAS